MSGLGRAYTEAAGAYPEELTEAMAAKIVETWKRVLNLEWLRYQMKMKTTQVNQLQIKWLENEEKRRKRVYEDTSPVYVNPLSTKPKKQKQDIKMLEAHDNEEEALPSSSTGPSKKRIREDQNGKLAACAIPRWPSPDSIK